MENFIKKSILFVGLLVLTFNQHTYAGTIRCEDLFTLQSYTQNHQQLDNPFEKSELDAQASFMLFNTVKQIRNSTTSNRVENKFVLRSTQVNKEIENLAANLLEKNILVKLRDQVISGRKNVTHTFYFNRFAFKVSDFTHILQTEGFDTSKINNKNDTATLGIRVRKYGTIKESENIDFEKIEYAEITKESSFLELKFENIEIENSVFKPRAYVPDYIINSIGTENFVKNFDDYKKIILKSKVNEPNQESVNAMLDFILRVQKDLTKKNVTLQPISENLYERKSYTVDFVSKEVLKPKAYQIQMTVDNEIQMRFIGEENKIMAYRPDVSVVEIKTPVEISNLNLETDHSFIFGYEDFLNFKKRIVDNHLKTYRMNSGKMFHAKAAWLNSNKAKSKSIEILTNNTFAEEQKPTTIPTFLENNNQRVSHELDQAEDFFIRRGQSGAFQEADGSLWHDIDRGDFLQGNQSP